MSVVMRYSEKSFQAFVLVNSLIINLNRIYFSTNNNTGRPA